MTDGESSVYGEKGQVFYDDWPSVGIWVEEEEVKTKIRMGPVRIADRSRPSGVTVVERRQ